MSKYRARACVIDGIRFHSQREGARYLDLKLLEKAGEIKELELQPKFPLYACRRKNGELVQIGTYISDFRYRQGPRGILVIEDVKGYDVPLGKWKRKHAELQYGIDVVIIR